MNTRHDRQKQASTLVQILRTAASIALVAAIAIFVAPARIVAQPPATGDEKPPAEKPAAEKPDADAPPTDDPFPPDRPPAKTNGAEPETAKPVDRGKLPWMKAGTSRAAVVRPQITSARQLLVTLDDSQLENFYDRQPLNVNEDETLYRILFRLPNVGQHHVERLVTRDVAWQTLVDDPAPHRIEIFKLKGRVKKVVRAELLPEMAQRLEFERFYKVTLQLDDCVLDDLRARRAVMRLENIIAQVAIESRFADPRTLRRRRDRRAPQESRERLSLARVEFR